jgi:hypothetical protein
MWLVFRFLNAPSVLVRIIYITPFPLIYIFALYPLAFILSFLSDPDVDLCKYGIPRFITYVCSISMVHKLMECIQPMLPEHHDLVYERQSFHIGTALHSCFHT